MLGHAARSASPADVLSQMWAWTVPSMLAGTAACASTVWTLEGRASLWMRHAEAPNMPGMHSSDDPLVTLRALPESLQVFYYLRLRRPRQEDQGQVESLIYFVHASLCSSCHTPLHDCRSLAMLGQLLSKVAVYGVFHAAHAVVQLPLSVAAAIGASADSAPHGAVMLWPLCHIRAGNELMRDALPGQRSLQRAAALLTLLSNPRQGSAYPVL